MKSGNTISITPVGDLCQMPDELRVIWIANRLHSLIDQMSVSTAPAVEKGR